MAGVISHIRARRYRPAICFCPFWTCMTFTRTASATALAGWKNSKGVAMKRIVTIGVVSVGLLLLSIIGFGAGRSEVADALMRGDKAAARKLVEQHADVNAPQSDGATALHWAVFQSDKEMVDLLLKAKANPSVSNREGATPLWLASINGNAPIIAALLDAGANANEPLPLG